MKIALALLATLSIFLATLLVAPIDGLRCGVLGAYSLPAEITVGQAIDYIEESKASHQFYIDHPRYCSKEVGNVEWHEKWVERYSQVIEVLEVR